MDISPDDEQSEIIYNIANSYFFLRMYPETIEWCQKILQTYPEEQMEALYLIACSYYNLSDMDSCMKYLAFAFQRSNYCFEEEYLNDKRFSLMFADISNFIKKKQQD